MVILSSEWRRAPRLLFSEVAAGVPPASARRADRSASQLDEAVASVFFP